MTGLKYDYNIRFDFPRRLESAAAVADRFLKTLDSLSHIDALFTAWRVIDSRGRASRPLAEVRSQFADIVARNVVHDDQGPSPEEGYHASAMVGKFEDPRSADFSVRAGGRLKNYGNLEFASWRVTPDPAIVIYPRYRAALLAINAQWQPVWACAFAFKMEYYKTPLAPGAPLFPYSRFHVPWIAYLSAPLALGVQPPADVRTERAPDGGLLITTTEERLDPTNPEHLRRARIVADTMIAHAGAG
jgi:immunity protein 52 of polymorphic toxin system